MTRCVGPSALYKCETGGTTDPRNLAVSSISMQVSKICLKFFKRFFFSNVIWKFFKALEPNVTIAQGTNRSVLVREYCCLRTLGAALLAGHSCWGIHLGRESLEPGVLHIFSLEVKRSGWMVEIGRPVPDGISRNLEKPGWWIEFLEVAVSE